MTAMHHRRQIAAIMLLTVSMFDSHLISAALTSGAASLVEFIEALTVVLALGATRSWRSALCGAAAAVALLVLMLALFGQVIAHVPVRGALLVLGILLLLFGTRSLRKATRRAAGLIPLPRSCFVGWLVPACCCRDLASAHGRVRSCSLVLLRLCLGA